MDAEKLNAALYEKMAAEQKEFRSQLMQQSPEEILNHAVEYSTREDILMEMSALNLPAQQAAALLESPSPLADIYKDFQKVETNQMEVVSDCIKERAEKMLEKQKEASAVPFYQESGEYALKHGELDAYRASRKANVACRDAIESAIREGFDGMYLSGDAAKNVLAEFSPERVSYVLAATLQAKTWDQRFSPNNHAWAAAVPMIEPSDRRCEYVINSHSAVLDGFVRLVRKEMDAMREQPTKKPSIKAQLAAKTAQVEKPAQKQKDRDVR